ncbi:hypothetical protein FRB90_011924, partial [Tulasnella sp. 427]
MELELERGQILIIHLITQNTTLSSEMTEKLSVFILDGPGYIGGSALVDLKPRHTEARFVTLVRRQSGPFSGTGLLVKELDGVFHNDKVYDDSNVEDIKGIPDDAFHRNVDLDILFANEPGPIDAYIVAPCTVYGKSRGPLPRLSIQINGLIKLALRRKELVQVGPSANVWNSVHIDDLSTFNALLFDYALSGEDKSTDSFERFYW